MVAVLICSDSFGFFFLVDGGSDPLGDKVCDEDDVAAFCKGVAGDTFLPFFVSVFDSVFKDFTPFAVGSDNAAASGGDDV